MDTTLKTQHDLTAVNLQREHLMDYRPNVLQMSKHSNHVTGARSTQTPELQRTMKRTFEEEYPIGSLTTPTHPVISDMSLITTPTSVKVPQQYPITTFPAWSNNSPRTTTDISLNGY